MKALKQTLARRAAALILAAALVAFGALAGTAQPAAAASYAKDIQACSYAGGYCIQQLYSYGNQTACATWYLWQYGGPVYDGGCYALAAGWYNFPKWVAGNARADLFVIDCPASCFLGNTYIQF